MVFYEQMIITLDRDHYQGDSGEVELDTHALENRDS